VHLACTSPSTSRANACQRRGPSRPLPRDATDRADLLIIPPNPNPKVAMPLYYDLLRLIQAIQDEERREQQERQKLIMSLADYSLNNPDTLTKYKTAAEISEKVLAEVSKLCVAGEKIVTICEKGDKLIEEEISKVWRGKKVSKGKCQGCPTIRRPLLTLSLARLLPPHHDLP